MLYVIAYSLSPDRPQRHEEVSERIEAGEGEKRRIANVWLVDTQESIDQLVGRLVPPIDRDADDRLWIGQVWGRTNGWLERDEWDWINPRTIGG